MQYQFPEIRTIKDVEAAIDPAHFFVAQKDGYQVINYHFTSPETFPALEDHQYIPEGEHSQAYVNNAIKREFRGIIFDMEGKIIRRPYHKFFNVGERAETAFDQIDVSASHVILDKLDGSMIAPFVVNGKIIWGTRMGGTEVSDQVDLFLAAVDKDEIYSKFAYCMIEMGKTPIFEWTSNTQKIVLDYPTPKLILTGIRDMVTGVYAPHNTLVDLGQVWKIPVVNVIGGSFCEDFMQFAKNLQFVEGFVIRFANGHMYKIKCDWYCTLHRVKSDINYERGVLELLLNGNMDDIKAMLPSTDLGRIEVYEAAFNDQLNHVTHTLLTLISLVRTSKLSRKDYALRWMPNGEGWANNIVFKTWDVAQVDAAIIRELIVNYILSHCTKNVKFDSLRKETSLLNNVPEWKPVMFSDDLAA